MRNSVIVNGRYATKFISGINRYSMEICRRLNNKIQYRTPSKGLDFAHGIPWEQSYLPFLVGNSDLLWSPGNTGPLLVANQVVTIHDLIPLDHPEWFKKSFSTWYQFLIPRLCNRAKHIISISEYSKERISSVLGVHPEKITTIPEGIGENFKRFGVDEIKKSRDKYNLPEKYFLVVSSFEPRKNLGRLLKSWQIVHENYPEIDLVIVGISRFSPRDYGFSHLPPGAKLAGYVDEKDLPAVYSGAIGLVYPSIYEGFGLPVLEAMACGTPVAASNSTSIPEVVGDAGLLFDPFDIEDMAHSIGQIIHSEDLRVELRQHGFEQANKFSWDTTAEKVWSVLRQSLAEINS